MVKFKRGWWNGSRVVVEGKRGHVEVRKMSRMEMQKGKTRVLWQCSEGVRNWAEERPR
jgi:hypothetical protein